MKYYSCIFTFFNNVNFCIMKVHLKFYNFNRKMKIIRKITYIIRHTEITEKIFKKSEGS